MVGTRRSAQAIAPLRGECGYAMVALLVAIAVMSIVMSAALPAWRQASRREKEAELIWRGRQYDRALQLYRRQNSVPGPPSVDALVEGRFLRKKYKDPITKDDFDLRPVSPMGSVEEEPAEGGRRRQGSTPRPTRRRQLTSGPGRATGQLIGGVRSRSKERSIMILNGRQRYNEWEFVYTPFQDRQQQNLQDGGPNRPGMTPRNRRPGTSRGSGPSGRSPRQRNNAGEP